MTTVPQLLKEFSKRPGCEDYKGDSAKIDLLITYLWVRQLTPDLSFEGFLERFAPLADFNDENRKHPEAALKFHCPRNAKVATTLNKPQWSAGEVVDYMTLYVDMVREAESKAEPVPLTFDQFLPALSDAYRSGAFNVPEAPAEPAAKKGKLKQSELPGMTVAPPTGAGQHVIYSMGSGRQVRGVVQLFTPLADMNVVTIISYEGETFANIPAAACEVQPTPTTSPEIPQNPAGEALPMLGSATLNITAPTNAECVQLLAYTALIPNVPPGDALKVFAVTFPDGLEALLDIVCGQTGPFVDARLVQGDKQLDSLPPRKSMVGQYRFVVPQGFYHLEVNVNG